MKNIIPILFVFLISAPVFSQNIFVSKRDYSVTPRIHSLQKLNQTNGAILGNYDYTTTFSSNYSPKSLSFNPQTNEIFGLSGNMVVKYNITTGVETSFTLPTIANVDYKDLVIANNRLFISKRDYSSSLTATYIHSLVELDQTTGSVVNSYNYTTSFPSGYSPKSLTYNVSTKEIIGISADAIGASGTVIVKYNIESGSETFFTLPYVQSVDYGDIVVANNRLFITKRDYHNSSNYIHSLQEIDQTNGNVINSYNFTTTYPNNYSPASLSFDNIAGEIYGISDKIVTKYNLKTGAENSFVLTPLTSGDYGDIVSTNSEDALVTIQNLLTAEKSKPLCAYNLLGQEIPIETYNQIVLVKFENGEIRKIFVKR